MCNLAGYIGKERAGPVLIDLMQRQEGFGGGYYTGMATISDGKLHYAKVIGDLSTLLEETDAESLPGNVGIIHSRSKSGGYLEWAHPFISCDGRMAYIANGHAGFFEDKREKNAIARKLFEAGHTFYSRTSEKTSQQIQTAAVLADDSIVHASEVMCCHIESCTSNGVSPAEGMRRAFMSFPAEIAGLMLHTRTPESIIASRISQPLMIGRSEDGAYLSTTALAFPKRRDIRWVSAMPINAAAVVSRDSIKLLPFTPPPGRVAGIFPWAEGYKAVMQLLSEKKEPLGLQDFKNATAPLWEEDAAPQKDMMVYEILRSLYQNDRIDFNIVHEEGVLPGTTAPRKAVVGVEKQF